MSDPYLYEEIPVLKNKLDIRVEETLALVEAELSRANMMLLYEQGFHDFSPDGLGSVSFIRNCLVTSMIGLVSTVSSTSKSGSVCWQAAAFGTATTRTSRTICKSFFKK